MKRRKFLKKAALTAGTVITAPYILPTGRLFAATGERIVNHVVFVLFAGGIRQQESVEQQYIATQDGASTTGNVMRNMLSGTAPTNNLQPFGNEGMWDPILSSPLAQQGTLFREVIYQQGPPGHYNGHAVAMTGNYYPNNINLNQSPENPTIFELYRKHNDPVKSAINSWWISEGLGPYPSLNYSQDPFYGAAYGANYLRPASIFAGPGQSQLGDAQTYQPDDVQRISKIKTLLDNNFDNTGDGLPGISNTEENRELIKSFLTNTIQNAQNGNIDIAVPTGSNFLTGDLLNVSSAWTVLKEFSPELTVINTTNLDVCHENFSNYLNFLHRADYGIGWLWDKIQGPEGAAAGLKDDTIMICVPEHGRNWVTNNNTDSNGMRALDHTNEDLNELNGYDLPYINSRRIFSLIVGPSDKVVQNQVLGSPGNPIGESIDIAPTIANILGFDDSVPSGMLPGRVLDEAFI